MKRFKIGDIKQNSLCLGCGLCEAVIPDVRMIVNSAGFIVPDIDRSIDGDERTMLNNTCPAINISCIRPKPSSFGNVLGTFEGWANDGLIRFHASSGGVITALGCYLLENRLVNGVIQVRQSPNHYMRNEVFVSRNKSDVIECAASRYAPVSMFKNIIKLLDSSNEKFAFIGKPCDVATVKRLLDIKPEYRPKIEYLISLVCAGTPSYNATEVLIEKGKNGKNITPLKVTYRGDGWPGDFKVRYNDKSEFKCNYNDSWGHVLGRNLNFRCKICPDGIGKFADIVVGDSWNTKNGYPDFTEQDGKSFILARTEKGLKLINDATTKGYITISGIAITNLKFMQPYQYQRLLYAGYKLVAAKICIGSLLKISNISLNPAVFLRGIHSMLGTIKRFKRR